MTRTPDEPTYFRTRNRRPRPFAIEHRWLHHADAGWHRWKQYRTEDERDRALDTLRRSAGRGVVSIEYRAV
jgi:hypothetical protein